MAETTFKPRDAATMDARVETCLNEIGPFVDEILAVAVNMVDEHGHSKAMAGGTVLFAAGFVCRRLGVILSIDPTTAASDPLVNGYQCGATTAVN